MLPAPRNDSDSQLCKSPHRLNCLIAAFACALALGIVCTPPAQAQNDEPIGNEYRLTLFPYHRITDELTGFGYLGYVNNPEKEYQTYYLGWGASYSLNHSVQLWGGLIGMYTANQNSAEKLELRPFAGVKLFVSNDLKWNLYNFTRYEYRAIEDRDTHEWSDIHRLRSRFGVEAPLTARERAWQPKTLYALADVEPYYRFDRHRIDPFRVRGGLGYVLNDHIRLEFIYHAQYTRPEGSSGLEYTDNIYRLNIKIGLQKGIVGRLQNPDIDD